jgi:hypothetical protein
VDPQHFFQNTLTVLLYLSISLYFVVYFPRFRHVQGSMLEIEIAIGLFIPTNTRCWTLPKIVKKIPVNSWTIKILHTNFPDFVLRPNNVHLIKQTISKRKIESKTFCRHNSDSKKQDISRGFFRLFLDLLQTYSRPIYSSFISDLIVTFRS